MADQHLRRDPPDPSALIYTPEEEDSPLSDTLNALPSFVARGVLYIVLAFLLIALVWAVTNKIDVVIRVPAVIIPDGKTQFVQAALPGIVQEVAVHDGDMVKKDQVLLILDAEAVGRSLADVKEAEAALALAAQSLFEIMPQKVAYLTETLTNARDTFALTQDIHRLSLDKVHETLQRQQLDLHNAYSQHAFVDKELQAHQQLQQRGLIAELKLLEVQRAYEEARARIEYIQSQLRDTAKERALMEKNFAVTRKQYDALVLNLQEQIKQLQRDAEEQYSVTKLRYEQAKTLAQLNLRGVHPDTLAQVAQGVGQVTNRTVITASEDGIISQVLVRNPGVAVERGQTLMTLIPHQVALVAELQISNQDIGTLHPGQLVHLKFDAFPYTEHGVIAGHIVRLAPEAQDDGRGMLSYQAIVALRQTYFRVGTAPRPLLPGMTALAEIVTEQKTFFALLLRPLQAFARPREAAR